MKIQTLSTLLISLFLFFSCGDKNDNETGNNEQIIKEFYKTYNAFGTDSVNKFFTDSTLFIYKADSEDVLNWEELSDDESYFLLVSDFFYGLGFEESDNLTLKIDTILKKETGFIVKNSVSSLFFDEINLPRAGKTEEIYIKSGKIHKIVLTEENISDDIKKTFKKFESWYTDFYDIYEHPLNDVWSGSDEPEYIKSVAASFKSFLDFEKALGNTYKSDWSLEELAEKSFLNNTYHGDPVMFLMTFKELHLSDEETDEDFELFLSYALFSRGNMQIYTAPANQAIDVLKDLKPGTRCYIYGTVSKFLTGELALENVKVYTLKN